MAKSSGLKNAPAKTGNSSGKGRGNNPPKSTPAKGGGAKGGSKK